ncbi:MAG: hypothetical protein DSY55_04835, partial [Clostridia bacterium]
MEKIMNGKGNIRFDIYLLMIAVLLMFLVGCTVSVGDQGIALNAGATATAAATTLADDNMIQTAVAATLTQTAALTPTPEPATPTPEAPPAPVNPANLAEFASPFAELYHVGQLVDMKYREGNRGYYMKMGAVRVVSVVRNKTYDDGGET